MNCPNDNVEIKQVKVASHYGQTVILDQCPQCGGIWFDYLELYSVKQGQAKKIDVISTETLRTTSLIEKVELLCPRDSVTLVNFQDAYFPKDIILARCPACRGFWLNRGEFIKYQNFRQSLKQARDTTEADKTLEQDIKRILAEHDSGDTAVTLGNLGRFLSTPMDSTTWQTLEPEKLSEKEKSTIDIALNTLMVLLRFFIPV